MPSDTQGTFFRWQTICTFHLGLVSCWSPGPRISHIVSRTCGSDLRAAVLSDWRPDQSDKPSLSLSLGQPCPRNKGQALRKQRVRLGHLNSLGMGAFLFDMHLHIHFLPFLRTREDGLRLGRLNPHLAGGRLPSLASQAKYSPGH